MAERYVEEEIYFNPRHNISEFNSVYLIDPEETLAETDDENNGDWDRKKSRK